jgi:pilus assembly protein CpaF
LFEAILARMEKVRDVTRAMDHQFAESPNDHALLAFIAHLPVGKDKLRRLLLPVCINFGRNRWNGFRLLRHRRDAHLQVPDVRSSALTGSRSPPIGSFLGALLAGDDKAQIRRAVLGASARPDPRPPPRRTVETVLDAWAVIIKATRFFQGDSVGSNFRSLPPRPTAGSAGPVRTADRYFELKSEIHKKLIGVLNLDKVSSLPKDRVRAEIGRVVERLLEEERLPMTTAEANKMVEEVLDEVLGLGPLEPLLKEPSISDILVNGYNKVYIERGGKLSLSPIRFKDNQHLLHIIEKIVSQVGRRIDEAQPIVDARLLDGSRVNAIIPPLALDGPALSIRRFGRHVITSDEMIANRTITQSMLRFLAACVQSKASILISGGTGSGKTTTLNAMSRFIPEDERIITIEDTAELQLQQRHVVKFETRPPNVNKTGGINQRQLLRTALRMRPDRIIVGECRGAEALDMLQAMNTGVEGSMTTIHANTPKDAFSRLEAMILMADLEIPNRVIVQQLAGAIKLVLQVTRLQDGSRKIVSISEVTGVEEDRVATRDIFIFDRTGVSDSGKVQGRFRWTGYTPKIMERIQVAGISLPKDLFDEVVEVNL